MYTMSVSSRQVMGTTGEQAAEQRSSCPNGRPMYDDVQLAVRAPIARTTRQGCRSQVEFRLGQA
jgi:hypothetical protein